MGILNYILRIMRVVGGVANKDFQAPSPQMSFSTGQNIKF